MKVKDKLILGIVSGLIGNLGKSIIAKILMEFGLGKKSGRAKAIGMFLPKYKLFKLSPLRKLMALISDYTVAGMLGTLHIFVLCKTGKNHYKTKGLALGIFEWNTLWGAISRLGVTSAYPFEDKDNLNGLINHAVYGVLTNEIAVRLGEDELFSSSSENLK